MTINSVVLLLVVASVSVNGQGVVPGIDNRCFEPVLTGVCRAYIPAFYFDPLSGSCDCFVYGGCQGNNNRFGTLEECHKTCSVRPELQFNTPACQRILGSKNPLASLTFSPHVTGATGLRAPDTAQPQPSQPEPAQPQPAQPEPTQPEPAQPQPTQTEAPQPKPAQTEAPSQPKPSQPAPSSSSLASKGVTGVIIGPNGIRPGTISIGQPIKIPSRTDDDNK
ncbi:papilin-like [Macrobrachium nipponense]|uniref:papilin-like n=1 Tax=Macrobrachium nipponense TaxID=159736 RepID=UPI0030C7BED2